MATARRLFIAGNWKMNLDRAGAEALAETLAAQSRPFGAVDIAVCPPFPYLLAVGEKLAGTKIALGAQNAYFEASGAFTGEVAMAMLVDCHCRYVIVGHSERRHVLGETDETINRKVKAALAVNLAPILCVGELEAEREAGKTNDVVASQLQNGLLGVPHEQIRQVTIAYEPVWAIGTGKMATPQQAEDCHAFIRAKLTERYGADLAQVVRIQYGGSAKAENVEKLLSLPNVDGALVGGAALKPDDFLGILRLASKVSG
ncbi:MAG TPA: triose-phosphate isomerase [Planctomycetia bacterium]|nr:triose-phosphate isomerase [Planctomycetia bacterium]